MGRKREREERLKKKDGRYITQRNNKVEKIRQIYHFGK